MNFNQQYLHLIKQVLETGDCVQSRNSKVFQYFCPENITVLDVSKEFPILSVRKIPFYKSALETFFFLSGESSYDSMPEVLRESWWKPWAEQAEAQNSWGAFYGHQWRHQTTESGTGFDAWENLIQELCEVVKTGVINRKMCVSLCNKPGTMQEYTEKPSVLIACHSSFLSFNLVPKWPQDDSGYAPAQEWFLDLHHTQRSLDLFLGTGADLIYSGLIMHLLCQEITNSLYCVESPESTPIISPRKLVFTPSNAHIYESHIATAKKLLLMNDKTNYYKPVQLILQGPITNFNEFKTIEDVKQVAELKGYNPNWGEYSAKLYG